MHNFSSFLSEGNPFTIFLLKSVFKPLYLSDEINNAKDEIHPLIQTENMRKLKKVLAS